MKSWLREIYLAARGLAASPTLSLVAVATLALGIGAVATIFSVVDTVLIKPLPYPQPDRLVRVFSTVPANANDPGSTSLPDYFDWKHQSKTLEGLSGFMRWSYNVTGEDGKAQRLWGSTVTYDLFSTLRVEPVLGRTFLPEEDRPGGEKVAVLSYGLWQSLFAGSPDVLGKKIRLDEIDHSIVGVMPPGFEFPSDARLWVPLGFGPDTFPRMVRFLRLAGRVRPEASLDQAQAEMSAIAQRLELQYPETNKGRGVRLVSLQEHLVGQVRPALLVLLGAAALVLLIACANVTNLLLSRANARRSETALRRALGASRGRLFGQTFIETLVLFAAGAVLGLVLAALAIKVLVALNLAQQNPSVLADRVHEVPRLAQVGIDRRVVLFAGLVSLAAAVIVSLFPALQVSEKGLVRLLKDGGKGQLGLSGGLRLRSLFVVAGVAIALTLVIGAGLLIRSFNRRVQVDSGFRSDPVLTFQLSLPMMRYLQGQQTADFYNELLRRIEALPGVTSAGLTWGMPMGGLTASSSVAIEGRPLAAGEEDDVALQPVSPRYFETLGVRMLHGRSFTSRDDRQA